MLLLIIFISDTIMRDTEKKRAIFVVYYSYQVLWGMNDMYAAENDRNISSCK